MIFITCKKGASDKKLSGTFVLKKRHIFIEEVFEFLVG